MNIKIQPLVLFEILSAVALIVTAGCNTAGNASSFNSSGPADSANGKQPITLLNASYDPTREFYQEFNVLFAGHWKQQHGQQVTIDQSHGGSGKQARAVIDGLEADVVTLALAYDIDAIADKAKLLQPEWQSELPHNSAPYSSTIVFLVRKGNPKQIKDWDDLLKDDVSIITPNPKTSGGARWNYLAAWGFALRRELGDLDKLETTNDEVKAAELKARRFVAELYRRVPVLDSGARGSTNTFVQRGIGDVLLAWENEAFLAMNDAGLGQVEMVVPSISIHAEPPVAVVSKIAAKRGTTEVAKAYLEHLYSPQGQQLAAKHFFRPALSDAVTPEQLQRFAELELFRIDQVFGNWRQAQAKHFDDGGVFDQIYQPGK